MNLLESYFTNSSIIKSFDLENNKISYKDIIQYQIKEKLNPEERVRAYLMTKFINMGYKPEYIEIEKTYDIGRPKVNKPRIDIILRDKNKNAFLFVELKTPEEFEKDKDEISTANYVKEKMDDWFYPDHRENKWAKDYIYGIEFNFNLGTSTKVNMILHGDGSTNIFVQDGLLPFNLYTKSTAPNALNQSNSNDIIYNKLTNGQFDLIISNPPFSVTLDKDTKETLKDSFLFGAENSENLFIERWYQLLRANGRLAVVLPENIFDTTENKYIRLFLYKFFKIKAVVSLPQLTFEPYTSTKTSLLFAQKKTIAELEKWEELWKKYSNKYGLLKTRVENLLEVYLKGKDKNKLPSIKNLTDTEQKEILIKILKTYFDKNDENLTAQETVNKYQEELKELCKFDKSTVDVFGYVNTWWVFGEVAKELNYQIFMAEVENIGYKRTKRGEKPMPNELYRSEFLSNGKEKILLSDEDRKIETVLDYMRKLEWE